MDIDNIIKEIILFENEKYIWVYDFDVDEYVILTVHNYHTKKMMNYFNVLNNNEILFSFFNCSTKTEVEKDFSYDNKLNIYIDNYDYDKKIYGISDWHFRMFCEDFDLENFKKVINQKKYINDKYINNFKKIKPDLFIKYQ